MDTNIKQPPITKSFAGKGVFPSRWAFTLLIPIRNIFLSPKQLIKRLELKDDHQVLEVGPGPGYFSLHVARALKKGKLVLADIQNEMLQFAKNAWIAKDSAMLNIHFVMGAAFRLPMNPLTEFIW